MGYIQPMNAIRVPKAKFKYNMRPFVDEAKGGQVVIVTNDGRMNFKLCRVFRRENRRECPSR